ncbi:uroporphyrinogen decarboxylase family protein [Sporomusa sp. KB1]|jgi:hypothetical protein|uniref:uroporphyrinogen decarboxylase family protein n=1 Tax=Sporomusa sp. KB1 TaxID=943346 RepID=UPI0011A65CAB|nr:uroporphyrinogen decarboxylase family protein [Sporomusa sp. KB1]TWH47900.1 Uroporphyrinogen-III decarboxylase [Sporomusa sp. KB1]
METTEQVLAEKMTRIQTAVSLGKPDRIPVIPCATAFCAKHMGVKLSEFSLNVELGNEIIFKSFTSFGDIDGVQQTFFYVPVLSSLWYNKVKLPGYQLPEGTLWQMDEAEMITIDDYDTIIDKGWNAWSTHFFRERMDNILEEKILPALSYAPTAAKKFLENGIIPFSPAIFTIPLEMLCGGRTMVRFIKDMFKIPDKVQAVFDVMQQDNLANVKAIASLPADQKPPAAWVGGWRGASEFLSPKTWQRFVWPYYKQVVEAVVDGGMIAVLHLDSNWERDLEFFRQLPKGKCIFAPDGSTNIFKIKEVLGNHMCISGDVPAAMLSLGTPDDVYKYATKLINEIGPSGFIMASGCDIPANAKPENVKALISACTGK